MAQPDREKVRAILEEGLRAHSEGRVESAREAYSRALAIAPDHADALNLMGMASFQLGDAAQAAHYLERAVAKVRNHPGLLGNLAQVYFALGRYDQAEEAFREASRLDPRNVYFQLGVANSVAAAGDLRQAEVMLRDLANRFPGTALVWFNLGNALREQKELEDALPCYREALELDRQLSEAHNNLGSALHGLYRFDEAEAEYRACIAMAPDYLPARYNVASVVIDAGRFREAEQLCRELTRRDPSAATAHSFLAITLSQQGRLQEALACRRRAFELAPEDAKVIESYAVSLAATGDLSGALRCFGRALAVNPDSTSAHFLLGAALLSHGCLADGWLEYGHRPAFHQFRDAHPELDIARTVPTRLAGETLCVMREQGLGDELFFMRYASQLAAAGARIHYCASNKIRRLFERVAFIEQVLDETVPLPQGTLILAGDLPHAISSRPASSFATPKTDARIPEWTQLPIRISVFWPPVPPSLSIEPDAAELGAVQSRLARAGKPPYLGVTWRGGIPPSEQRGAAWSLYKEIPMESFAEAVRGFPGTVIALQRNPEPGEIERFSGLLGREVDDFCSLNENLETMLAALALIDEYVGASNTNMHLRAAAGRTARVLVPCPAEWRWMAGGSSSPWFPGFSIYRQSFDGDWSPALAKLRDDLRGQYS